MGFLTRVSPSGCQASLPLRSLWSCTEALAVRASFSRPLCPQPHCLPELVWVGVGAGIFSQGFYNPKASDPRLEGVLAGRW